MLDTAIQMYRHYHIQGVPKVDGRVPVWTISLCIIMVDWLFGGWFARPNKPGHVFNKNAAMVGTVDACKKMLKR